MKFKETVEIYGTIKAETDMAILVDDGAFEVWLPKSQVEYYGEVGEECIVEVPEWLAYDKELI